MKKQLSLLTVILVLASATVHAQSGYKIINTLHIASSGGWDYLAVGPVNDWLYVSHGTQVNILNKKTGDSVGVIENTTGVHGIAFDVADNKGFTSNGRLNNVTVFDLNTNKVTGQIPTGTNPDAIMYEPFIKKIITCNGRSHNLSIIDPINNKLVDSVDVGGKPETAVTDGAGKIFVNIEDKNEIVAVDVKTFKVLGHWSLSPAEGPTGLEYDNTTKRLFAGCDDFLVVVDATNGKVVDKLPIGPGCDGVAFDAETKNIFTANGEDGTMTVIHEESANKFKVVENVATKRGARTITLDKRSHLIYMPTADFEPIEPGQKRPKMKAGTFQVVVAGK